MRPRIQIPILVAFFLLWGLLGVVIFTSGDAVAGRDWFGVVLGAVFILMGVAGMWRSARLGVVVDANGVCVRSLDGRDRATPWTDVKSVTCEQIGIRSGLPLYAPVIRVAAPAGGPIPVRALATYSLTDAQLKTERLRDLGGVSPDATPDYQPPATVDMVRRAAGYTRMLVAARLYASGFGWLLATGLVVVYSDLGPWWLLVCIPAAPLVASGVVLARRSLRALEGELSSNEVSAAAIAASIQDLLHRRAAESKE
jgi:hypothetical protein